jgi:hypothetical protein
MRREKKNRKEGREDRKEIRRCGEGRKEKEKGSGEGGKEKEEEKKNLRLHKRRYSVNCTRPHK